MSGFEIAVDHWLGREHGDGIQRATLGQLEVRIGKRSLTSLEDRLARAIRPFANLSAYDLAVWLTANWWRLRWEPERGGIDWKMTHSVAAVGSGYVWPDITMVSDGEQMSLQVRTTGSPEWEPVRYLENLVAVVSASEFESAVDAFLDVVLARLAQFDVTGTELHSLWKELRCERSNPEIASVRKLEALMGFDAGAAPDEVMDPLLSDASQEGRSAIDEIAAGFGSGAPQAVREVAAGLSRHGVTLRSERIANLASYRACWSMAGLPWERGAAAAKAVREHLGLDGKRVQDSELIDLVGAGASPGLLKKQRWVPTPIAVGRWTTPDHKGWSVLLRSRFDVGRRFEICRLIGDSLAAPEGELLLPATSAKTSRQKFQRAFAQEFLCPFHELQARFGSEEPDDEKIEEAAQHFRVSPLVIRTTLVNKGVLSRDQLEGEVGAQGSTFEPDNLN